MEKIALNEKVLNHLVAQMKPKDAIYLATAIMSLMEFQLKGNLKPGTKEMDESLQFWAHCLTNDLEQRIKTAERSNGNG